jgi:hypothetical protein
MASSLSRSNKESGRRVRPRYPRLLRPGRRDEQQAADIVRDVVLWYTTQLATERRAPVPDEDRIEELKQARQAALAVLSGEVVDG